MSFESRKQCTKNYENFLLPCHHLHWSTLRSLSVCSANKVHGIMKLNWVGIKRTSYLICRIPFFQSLSQRISHWVPQIIFNTKTSQEILKDGARTVAFITTWLQTWNLGADKEMPSVYQAEVTPHTYRWRKVFKLCFRFISKFILNLPLQSNARLTDLHIITTTTLIKEDRNIALVYLWVLLV